MNLNCCKPVNNCCNNSCSNGGYGYAFILVLFILIVLVGAAWVN